MIDDKTYQKIYDELGRFLLPDWEKIIIYLEYGEGSYAFSFYEKIWDKYVNGYDLPGVKEREIDTAFRKIDKLKVLLTREQKRKTTKKRIKKRMKQ